MAKPLRTVTDSEFSALKDTEALVRVAYQMAIRAAAPQLAKKLYSAVKSAGGAIRHAEGARARRERAAREGREV